MFNKLRGTKGSALLIVLTLMVLLTMIAIMSADRATLDIDLSYNQLHSEMAFYAADAGIKHAVAILNDSLSWRTGFVKQDIGGTLYSVAVIDSVTQPALLDTIILKATATASGAVANIEARVVPLIVRPFQFAAFANDSIIMKNTACTDSYNSDSGSYAATQLNDGGSIGSNGTIELTNQVDVYGDVGTSLEGGLSIDGSALVYGDTTSFAPPQDMTIVPDSEFVWAEANTSAPAGLSGAYSYDPVTHALDLNNVYDTVVLASGVYYFSTINLGQYASLTVAPGADVTIYMTDNLTLGQDASVNPDGSTSSLLIYSTGTELNLGQHTEFHGGFWGPNAAINVEQNTDVYGSMVGNTVSIANSACVHFDRSLSKVIRDSVTGFKVIAWREL